MQGELGALLLDDEKVGGFLDWTIEVAPRAEFIPGKPSRIKASAKTWWKTKKLPERLDVVFYKMADDRACPVDRRSMLVRTPGPIGERIYSTIEFVDATE